MIGVRLTKGEVWISEEEWARWVLEGRVSAETWVSAGDAPGGGWRRAGDLEIYRRLRPRPEDGPKLYPEDILAPAEPPPVAGPIPEPPWTPGPVPAPFISEPRAPEPTLPSLGAVVFPRAGFSSTESLVLLNLVVAGVLMFLWKENYRVELMHLLRQWFAKVDHGSYQYAVPTIFMHADPKHLFMNMASLLASSAAVEYLFGRWKAVAGYVITGLGGAALSFVNRSGPPISIGASGAIFGFAGLLTIFLVRYYRKLTVRQKWKTRRIYAPLLVLLFLPSLFHADGWAHLGGLGTGLALGLIFPPSRWIREHMRWSSRPPQRPPDETPELVLR